MISDLIMQALISWLHKIILAITGSTENPKKCDMISDLPDEVLVHILSFLPTKEAFKTSILSSRWKNLWTAVPNLDFKLNCYSFSQNNTDEEHRYMEFIKRIFTSHNSSINKCHLFCTPQFDMSILKDWIITIVERNVQDINIVCFGKDMELPESLFTCKTLCTLNLNRVLQHNVPASIHFPCLKVLHIRLLSPSSVLTQKLFCSSPLLEDLKIDVDYEDSGGEYIYNISSPSLKKLYIFIISYCSDNLNCVVNVDAPILESLAVNQMPYVHFILKNSKTLKKAHVRYCKPGSHDLFEELIKLLKSVSFVKDLSLGGYLPQVVFGNSSEDNWPAFPFVTHLTLNIWNDFGSWRLPRWSIFPDLMNLRLNLYRTFSFKNILNILSWAPNLSTLLIDKSGHDEIFSLEQTKLPSCLSSHVKEIELLGFRGCRSELKMIRYLLENARVLEKLTVEISYQNLFGRMPDLKRALFTMEISMLPRSSKNCKLVLI